MQQFVLVPDFVYNYSLKNQSVTKQKLPKYQPLQNPTFQFVSNKEEINKNLLGKANPFVLSMYQALRLGNFNFEWCRTWNWTVRLCSTTAFENADFQTFTFLYLMSLVSLPLWIWVRMPNLERERESQLDPSQKLNIRSCRGKHGGAANGSLCNLVKASNLSAA